MFGQRLVVALVCIAITLVHDCRPALSYHGKFPGKGSRGDWLRAARLSDLSADVGQAGDLDKAVKLIKSAIAIYPHDPGFYYNLSVTLWSNNREAEALIALDQAIGLAPKDFAYRIQRAMLLTNMRRFPEAEQEFGKAKALAISKQDRSYYQVRIDRFKRIKASPKKERYF